MRLGDILEYNNIVIQCHDNPDADTICAGFALYRYLFKHNRNVKIIYSGKYKITKSNLVMLISKLDIPIEYVGSLTKPDLLITIDCQYKEGNVSFFEAENVAVIDHHQSENNNYEYSRISPQLGSCSSVIWQMLKEEGYDVNSSIDEATALYYGLYTDTNGFSEISHPSDRDMIDELIINTELIKQLRNSNLSLEELEIAGVALLSYHYEQQFKFGIIKSHPCDPNILGLISDLALQVDTIETCVVYSILPFGIKLSVRSCVKEVKANELVAYLTDNIGTGGGHYEKAGGMIQKDLLNHYYPGLDAGSYIIYKMKEYFNSIEVIYAEDYEINKNDMDLYCKNPVVVGYVKLEDLLPIGSLATIRTLDGDLEIKVTKEKYIIIGIGGEVYEIEKDKFVENYKNIDAPLGIISEYSPSIINPRNGEKIELLNVVKPCTIAKKVNIYARELTKPIKVFTKWNEDKYVLGKVGDYLAVRCDDLKDVYVIQKKAFNRLYEKI